MLFILPRRCWTALFLGSALSGSVLAQTSKIDSILQSKGLQIEANVDPNGNFDANTMLAANYDSVLWQWSSNTAAQGTPPGIAWGRWASDPTQMPPTAAEAPYMSQLRSLQLGDEPALDNASTFASEVAWFQSAEANPLYANTILFTDLNGVSDTGIVNFISQAHPDLLTFDVYPWQSTYIPASGSTPSQAGAPFGDPPTEWYGELRRFRDDTIGTGTEFGIYRQAFHSIEDYDSRVYRDPSPSEFAMNTFAAMAFNAKLVADFEFNDGATSFFTNGSMSSPTSLYTTLQSVNAEAHYFGRTLVGLTPLNDSQNGAVATTDIMFVRGQYKDSNNVTQYNAVPSGFQANNNNNSSYFTQWTAYSTASSEGNVDLAEDKWLTGFQAKNIGTTNSGLKGDAIISWFKPIGETKLTANSTADVYYMVVNGLTSPTGTAADCEQYINLDFSSAPATSIEYVDPLTGAIKVLNETNGTVPSTAPGGTYLLTPVSGKLRLSLFLDGGDAFLFKFDTGNPFIVNATPEPATLSLLALTPMLLVRRRRFRVAPPVVEHLS